MSNMGASEELKCASQGGLITEHLYVPAATTAVLKSDILVLPDLLTVLNKSKIVLTSTVGDWQL